MTDHDPVPDHLPLTEIARRRPDFSEGEWLTLGDGHKWSFPEVRAERTTHVGPGGTAPGIIWRLGRPSCPESEAHYQAVLDRIQLSSKEEIERRAFGIGVEVGGALLRRNYTLTDDDLDHLLSIGFWRRSLEDRKVYSEAIACYNAIQRIAFDKPMKEMSRLLSGFPTSKTWHGSGRLN
jgi:hypothetical protein